jgi:lipopolysaccharide/colanic/teichoic acid biosynthesis glycosyltransferase
MPLFTQTLNPSAVMIETLYPQQTRRNGVEWKWHSHAADLLEKPGRNLLLIGQAAAGYATRMTDQGYQSVVTHSIHEARNILLLDYFQKGRPLPQAIICDIRQDENLISHFASYLSITKEYAHIPFIVLLPSDEVCSFDPSRLKGIDDVFDCKAGEEDLSAKIELLRKYRHFRLTLPYHTKEEQPPHPVTANRVFQRSLDITVSSLALIALSPVFLGVAVAIRLDSKGPILYKSPRAGRAYKIFQFLKFRTMVPDADKKIEQMKHLNQYDVSAGNGAPAFFKLDKDPRVTRLGRFLRKTSLDELPQLINVLKGDMSLVGNRPLPLYEARTLTADESVQRFLAPAGITGLWQIKKRGQPNMSVQERINLDIDYANRHSFLYDLRILLRTPQILIQKAEA